MPAYIAPRSLFQTTPFFASYTYIYSCPPGKVDHTDTLIRFAIAICEIWAAKMFKFIYFSFFLLEECDDLALDYSFHTLCKSGYEMQMCNLNTLKFGRDKEHTCKGKSTQTQPSCKKSAAFKSLDGKVVKSNVVAMKWLQCC